MRRTPYQKPWVFGRSNDRLATEGDHPVKERILTVPVTAHVPLQDVQRIEAAARQQGVTRAAYVKELLRAEVARLSREAAVAAEVGG